MTEERRLAADRLADAISGERREWFRVEVSPDDLATLLAALPVRWRAAEDRQALWDIWTGGERLAYGLGLTDGQRQPATEPDLEALANDLYVAVVQPEPIWWDDLTPEMQDDWRRAARRVATRLAAQPSAEVERLRAAIDKALHELGVPDEGYPTPVANAVDILSAALAGSGLGDDHAT